MIVREYFMTRDDGVRLFRTYSDRGMMIQQEPTGILYSEAVDVENSGYTYTETDIPIEDEVDDSEALDILLGGGRDESNETDSAQTSD